MIPPPPGRCVTWQSSAQTPMVMHLLPSPLHGLGPGQLPGQSVANSQHVGAAVRQGALLIQHQPATKKPSAANHQDIRVIITETNLMS